MNYGELPYLMLPAIRELKTENDTLRGQMEQLKEEQTAIRQLRADVERLKASEKALRQAPFDFAQGRQNRPGPLQAAVE